MSEAAKQRAREYARVHGHAYRQTPEFKANAAKRKAESHARYLRDKQDPVRSELRKTRARERDYRKKFGISTAEYEAMLVAQNGVCKICHRQETIVDFHTGNVKRLAVDHDHKTGKVRGLLCDMCNRGIGMLQDSPLVLRLAAEYIEGGGK